MIFSVDPNQSFDDIDDQVEYGVPASHAGGIGKVPPPPPLVGAHGQVPPPPLAGAHGQVPPPPPPLAGAHGQVGRGLGGNGGYLTGPMAASPGLPPQASTQGGLSQAEVNKNLVATLVAMRDSLDDNGIKPGKGRGIVSMIWMRKKS